MQQFKVTGAKRVAGVELGGEVDLDPSVVDVDALVAARLVTPLCGDVPLPPEGGDD